MGTKPTLFTTRQVAEALGITRATLQAWIAAGNVEAPALPAPGMGVRLWSKADVERVKTYKRMLYRKGRGPTTADGRRLTVKIKETVWRLNARKRELTDGSRVFSFHPVGRYLPDRQAEITPIEWTVGKSSEDGPVVTDPTLLQELNLIFRFIHGRATRT